MEREIRSVFLLSFGILLEMKDSLLSPEGEFLFLGLSTHLASHVNLTFQF